MKIHLIGNAHLDPAWMWRWDEGFAAFRSTCRSALERIDETPQMIFTVSSAACFEYIENTDPDLFQRIKEAVTKGSWCIVGGWWVEPDCNLPSGESFIRQGLYGQHYFRSKFGSYCDTGYCIDSFGHNANLPTLLGACGMKHYVFMRPEHHEQQIEASLFSWHSPSNDAVTAYRIPLHYSNFAIGIGEKIEQLPAYPLYDPSKPWMLFYGVGNHGGGPTKEQLATIRTLQQKRNDLVFSSPTAFFAECENIVLPKYNGELYPHAIGAYSAHAEIKRLNRLAEAALIRAENLSVISEDATEIELETHLLDEAWKQVLLCQFHDTLGGVAAHEAIEEVISAYHEAISVSGRIERIATGRIASKIDTSERVETLLVVNSTCVAQRAPVEFELWNPEASEQGKVSHDVTLVAPNGTEIPTQKIEPSGKIGEDRVRFAAMVDVPSFGWSSYGIVRDKRTSLLSDLKITPDSISNQRCEIRFDGKGDFHYTPAIVLRDESDTWGHGIDRFDMIEGEFEVTKKTISESGPLRVRLRIESRYNTSSLVEDLILYSNSNIIEHRVRLDWRETRKVCKLRYHHGCSSPIVHAEIPYASVVREADSKEYPVGRWVFAEGKSSGVGIVMPTKTSYSCDGSYIMPTIARSAIAAHHVPPHILKENEDIRYLDLGIQEFVNYIVLGSKDPYDANVSHQSEALCSKPSVLVEGGHSGTLPRTQSFLSVDGEAVVPVIKHPFSSKRGGELIVRAQEPYGRRSALNLSNKHGESIGFVELTPFSLRTYKLFDGIMTPSDGLEA